MGKLEGYMHHCHLCGKEFYTHGDCDWSYRGREHSRNGKDLYFCSWGCLRKHEAESEQKKKTRKR